MSLLDFLIGSPKIFLEQGETTGEKRNDHFLFSPPETDINDINWPPTPQQVVINNMARHIPLGNVPPLNGNLPLPLQLSLWQERNIITVPGLVHDLQRHSEKYITNFILTIKTPQRNILCDTLHPWRHYRFNMRMSPADYSHTLWKEKPPRGFSLWISDQILVGINLRDYY